MRIVDTIKFEKKVNSNFDRCQKKSPKSDFKLELSKIENKTIKEDNLKTSRLDFGDAGYCIKQENENGCLVKMQNFDSSGNLIDYIDFVYNPDGSSVQTSKKADGQVTQITEKDANGRVVHNTWYNDDGSLRETSEYIYDKDTEIVITRNSQGEISNTWGYESSTSRTLFKTDFDTARNMWSTTNYEYYDDGSSKETVVYENGWVAVEIFKDTNGREVESVCYDEKGNLIETGSVLYDLEGQSFRVVIDNDGVLADARITDSKGQAVFDFDKDVASIKDYNKIQETVDYYANEISNKLSKMMPPTPPFVQDFVSENDYERALEDYYKKADAYDKKVNSFNKQMNRLELVSNICNEQKQVIEFEKQMDILVEDIEQSNFGTISKEISEQIKSYVDNFQSIVDEKIFGHNEVAKIQEEIFNLEIPTPPNVENVSEEEYKVLYDIYNAKIQDYNTQKSDLELQIEIQRKRAEVLSMIMSLLYSRDEEETLPKKV